MPNFVQKILHPAWYHGNGKRPPFFEGWYYKLVSADEAQRMAVIPGVIFGEKGHAFIQILDGVAGASTYHTFDLKDFSAAPDHFEIHIGPSCFTLNHISLAIDDPSARLSGELNFSGGSPWPVSLLSPGIMGWYAWIPRMECYHGVLSFDHKVHGALDLNGQPLDFTSGRGYIEKDWGQSFPSAWIWFQSNHFTQSRACITASVAMIPWMHSAFRGFIVGLWLDGDLYRFATYTGAHIESLRLLDDGVEWTLRDRRYRLELLARQAPGAPLRGPTKIEMGKRVDETLSAAVFVRLTELSGEVLFEDTGHFAGLEVNGNIKDLTGL